ncbi:MAG: S8 family serine peptidase, partial [bacterium]
MALGSSVDHSLNVNEPYFKNAIEKSKVNNFGQGRTIAILDTGINDDNVELRGKVVAEFDFTTNTKKAIDTQGHGTKMASIIASANDGRGITGIAYNAKLIDAKVVADDGTITNENIIKAIDFSVKHGANVINMSFSSGAYSKLLESTIEKYAKQGVVFVAAAGNDGEKVVTYPAGYKHVFAVSSLDRKTKKRAIYANHGEYVNKYIEDGIWTYDGKKYSREYGTSASSSVVSGYIKSSGNIKLSNILGNNISSNYKIATKSSTQNITFDDLLETNEGNSYLNSLSQYIMTQHKVSSLIKHLDYMEVYNLDTKYSHSISAGSVKLFSDHLLPEDMFARLFLFDMFGSYAELLIPDFNPNTPTITDQKISNVISMIDEMTSILDGSSKVIKPLQKFNKIVKKIVLETKGKKDPISKMIRKYVRIYAGEASSKDITSFKTTTLATNIDNANKILDSIETFKNALKVAKGLATTLGDDLKKQKYLQIYALDYVVAVDAMMENGFKVGTTYKLHNNVKTIIHNAVSSETGLRKFVDDMKYMGFVSFGLTQVGGIAYKVAGKGIEKIGDTDKPSYITLIRKLIANALGNDIEEAASIYKYNMYRNFLAGIKEEALHLKNNQRYGYIETKHILTHLITNIALKEFTYYAYTELYNIFKGNNWGGEHSTAIRTALSLYKISREKSIFTYKEIDMKDYIIDHVATSLLLIPTAVVTGGYNTVKNLFTDVNAVKKASLTDYAYYKSTLSKKDGNEFDAIYKIFKEDYNDIISTFTNYEKVIMEMYSAHYVYDLVTKQNVSADRKKADVDQIEADVNKATLIYNFGKAKDEKLPLAWKHIVRDNLIFGAETGLSLLDRGLFSKMNSPVYRKDFIIMMLKAAIDEFNPYADSKFIEELMKGKLNDTFSDLETAQDSNGNKLNTAEKMWLLYAGWKKVYNYDRGEWKTLIYGYPDKTLRPFQTIDRKEAFSLYGRLIASSKKIKSLGIEGVNVKLPSTSTANITHDSLMNDAGLGPSEGRGPGGFHGLDEINIGDFSDVKYAELEQYCPNITRSITWEKIRELGKNGQIDSHARNIAISYMNGIMHGSLVYIKRQKDASHDITKLYYTLGLSNVLTNYEASIIAKNLFQKLYRGDINTGIPLSIGEKSNIDVNKCVVGGDASAGTLSLLSAVGGESKEISFSTKVLEKDALKYRFVVEAKEGIVTNFRREYEDNGFLKIHVDFTPNKYKELKIIPLTITIYDFNGHSASKVIYVQVKQSSDSTDKIGDPTQPSTTLSALYIDSTNEFKVSWNSQNTKNLEILYSYDQSNWNRFALLNLDYYNGTSDTEKVNNSKLHNKIYFKAISSKGTERTTSFLTMDYNPQTANSTSKNTEIPAQAVMKSLKSRTIHNYVIPSWRAVLDSHGNDNAVSYELSYADNYRFENDTKINIGTSRSYRVNNLKDNVKYYFRVRAINYKGTGEWSSWESTHIDLENLPVFSKTEQTPSNGSTGVSKTPTFRWEASDADGDDLEYYVRIGTDPDNLNFKSGWIEGTKRFRYADEFTRPLKPNTKYYWQVTYREGHRTPEYYGGEYPKSDKWSFTTLGTGPDLAITNVRMIGDVKIDEWVSFEVTVKNNGSEVADSQDIKPYFVKSGVAGEFAAYKRGVMSKRLNPGEEEKVIVKVQFANKTEERTFSRYDYNSGKYVDVTKSYDNILIDGSNPIRFTLDYNQFDVDTNSANDSKDYVVSYSLADNLPVISTSRLIKNNLSLEKGDYRYMLGWKVTYQVVADDQVKIDKYVLEYRTSENDTWHHIQTYTNNTDYIGERIEWTIPNSLDLVTQTMQLRVKVYNPSGHYSSVVSPQFKVFENDISVDKPYVDKNSYKTGEKIIVTYDTSHKTEIEDFLIDIIQKGHGDKRLLTYKIGRDDVFQDGNSIQFSVPNDSNLLGSQAYIQIFIRDINGASKKIDSDFFTIVQNTDVPKVFSPYRDIFTQQYNNFPSDSTNHKTENYIKKMIVDSNGVSHLIIKQVASWEGKDSRGRTTYGNYNYRYYYMTYNSKTQYKSSPKIMFENDSINGRFPDEFYKDFIMNGNTPILLTSNSTTQKVKRYILSGGNVQASSSFTTNNYADGSLVNYKGKTYIVYLVTDSIQ